MLSPLCSERLRTYVICGSSTPSELPCIPQDLVWVIETRVNGSWGLFNRVASVNFSIGEQVCESNFCLSCLFNWVHKLSTAKCALVAWQRILWQGPALHESKVTEPPVYFENLVWWISPCKDYTACWILHKQDISLILEQSWRPPLLFTPVWN